MHGPYRAKPFPAYCILKKEPDDHGVEKKL